MKIKIRSSEKQVAIYRERVGVAIYTMSLAIGCAALGALFIYISDGSVAPLVFGILFIVVGVLLLTALPELFRRTGDDNGAVLLVADKAGVSIAPAIGMARVNYRWADVAQILLARKLITKEAGETGVCSDQIILCFRNDNLGEKVSSIKRAKDQLWRTPKGRSISVIDFPKGEAERVKNELVRFFDDSGVLIFSEVVFDYAENTEKLQP